MHGISSISDLFSAFPHHSLRTGKEKGREGMEKKKKGRSKEWRKGVKERKERGNKGEINDIYVYIYIILVCIGFLKSYNHIQNQPLLPGCSTGRLMELTLSS